MVSDTEEIELPLFRYLAGELPLKELEQWIYATPQIEDYWGEPAYLEFISFRFQQPAANYELSKLIYKYIPPGKYHGWQIKRLLKALLDNTQDPVDVFKKLYDFYCAGYWFLNNIGIQYVIGIDEIPTLKAQDLWDANEFARLRKLLNNHLESLKNEVEMVFQALETGEIEIINEKEYHITEELSERLKNLNKAIRLETSKSVIVKTHWIMKVFSVIGSFLFGFAAFMSYKTGEPIGTIAIFLFFAATNFYLWFLADSFIEVSNEKVMVSAPYSCYQIRWNEITSIKTNGKMYAFIGRGKRVVISLTFASSASRQALELINEQCKKRNLEIQNSVTVPFAHLNSKV